jgi:hypothetical protein|nr:MAG TPA: hypothetical protein [Caudoviricetes sp.]
MALPVKDRQFIIASDAVAAKHMKDQMKPR